MDQVVKVVKRYVPDRTDLGNARDLLYICKNQADNALWYTRKSHFCLLKKKFPYFSCFVTAGGMVGTDFRAKQILLMVHVWMMHRRLITEGKEGQRVQEAMFDQLWEDTSNRIRSHGVNELSVRFYFLCVCDSFSLRFFLVARDPVVC
jgi:hypothetical protein